MEERQRDSSRKRKLSLLSSSSASSSFSQASHLSEDRSAGSTPAAPLSFKLLKTELVGAADRAEQATLGSDLTGLGPFTCSLPPLCSVHPSAFQASTDLDAHYQKHHAHVCSLEDCRKIFPDDHFLSLHIREFHDPLIAIERDKGGRTVGSSGLFMFLPSLLSNDFFK